MIEKKYTVAFVDDNPSELKFIEIFLNERPELECVWIEDDSIKALERLLIESVDILFLDMQMPGINGVELVNALKDKPVVIVCSNHRDFVYQTSLFQTGYLEKITSRDVFNKTIDKAIAECELKHNHTGGIKKMISIPTSKRDGSYFVLPIEKIVYASIEDKTISFFLEDGTIKHGNISMESLLNQLPPYFFRVHKSYMININFIEEFNLSMIQLKELNQKIPIGRTFIKNVKKVFKKNQGF
jgi:two-component system LytT family response regulator